MPIMLPREAPIEARPSFFYICEYKRQVVAQ